MAIQSQSPTPPVHTRLERLEECVDSAAFLSLFATSGFYLEGILPIVGLSFVMLTDPASLRSVGHPIDLGLGLIALVVMWILYQLHTQLVLSSIVVIVLIFSFFSYLGVMSNPDTPYYLTAANLKFALQKTASSWPIFGCFAIALCYIDYQLVRAAWNISRVSATERAIVRGKGSPTLQGFLLQLFGLPTICLWLDGRQRYTSLLLFFLSTAALCSFVVGLLYIVIASGSHVAEGVSGIEKDIGRQLTPMKSLFVFITFASIELLRVSLILAILILLAGGLRFVARRFTRLSLEQLISSDPRRTILFLRAFRDDQVRLKKPRRTPFRWSVALGEPRPTLDHVLLEEATPYGPVVAIGKPGSTAPFGAARKYVTDHEWRETVAELCRDAAAVVITVDETEGVRWELQHLFGQNHVGKALFLLPPRLTAPAEVTRVLPAAFADWRDRGDWIEEICAIAAPEGRQCIGWFWRGDGRLTALTSPHNSSLAYLVAVRSFLHEGLAPATEAAPPPYPSFLPSGADERESRRARKNYLGGVMTAALGGCALSLVILNFHYGMFLLPAVFIPLGWWAISRTRLAPALMPAVGIGLGHSAWLLLLFSVGVGLGSSGEQSLVRLLHALTLLGLLGLVTARQSMGTAAALLIFESMSLVIVVGAVASEFDFAIAIHATIRAAEVAASIYAIVKLNQAGAIDR